MKEKRYLCDWWKCKEDMYKVKTKRIFILATALITFFFWYTVGLFSIPPYQEEKFDELEQLYQPYIHEEVGIDIVGLSKIAKVSKEALYVYDDEITLKYGKDFYEVTLHLDNNYNVTSITRWPDNEHVHIRYHCASIILYFLLIWGILYYMCLIIGFVLYSWSCVHKWINTKFHKKHTS